MHFSGGAWLPCYVLLMSPFQPTGLHEEGATDMRPSIPDSPSCREAEIDGCMAVTFFSLPELDQDWHHVSSEGWAGASHPPTLVRL